MKVRILIFISVISFLLGGCSENRDGNTNPSTQSTTSKINNEATVSTTQTTEVIESNVNSSIMAYGFQAPNDIYNHLIVTGSMKVIDTTKGTETRGQEYLYNHGYHSVSASDTTNSSQSYVLEDSATLPNGRNAYGKLIYFYFWCNDEMKQRLEDVVIDDDVIFFEATEEYLESITQLLNSPVPAQTQIDLDIDAINNGDFTTLVGTWVNGLGDRLIINTDGTTNIGYTLHSVKDSDITSKIPYASLSDGMSGAALGLYTIGFENPDGDNSDITKPRLTIAQQGGSYPADSYYYRQ
ncbi:hypothetical protein GCM10011573_36690 [Enterococcus wangshanyuanii]|uniref:DUF6287 domain-containing protein n=1 Tax=Enterococcus wangshanyuanii TaxID=2005703 RepID=A0ABQ1PUM5_9ENTE|nr:DUF6287 domain-containing protein [Enterococcus wangshanyuanii]GGD03858.1 hypothetical protein GCM10011573_36690 [Enterococcus wangshanyuanii]